MNILITGGAGFIGSHIADAYMAAGHQVVVVDNLSTGSRRFIPEGAKFYEMDIRSANWEEIFRIEEIHVVNHHAAQISLQKSLENPLEDAKSNILGTLQLIENALSSEIEKVIFASTGGAIYKETDALPVSEDGIPEPLSPYGISKLGAEHYLRFFEAVHNLKPVILRYSNVYGPRQNHLGEAAVVAAHCTRLNSGEPLVIYGDGEQTRDFISVHDVVEANLLALQPDIRGTFNIGTGIETSINNLTEVMISQSGKKVDIDRQPGRMGEQKRSALNSTRFQQASGWKPNVSLEEGLLETIEYFKTLQSD